MRVVHTFIKYPPAIGGHERYVQELVEGLRARGHDARVVTSTLRKHIASRKRPRLLRHWDALRGRKGANAELFLDGPYDQVNGVPVTRLEPRLPLTRRLELRGLRETLRALRPDVLHAHDIWRDSFEVTVDVARELGVPLLLNTVYHDLSASRRAERWAERFRRIAARLPEGTPVFFNTRWEEQQLAALGVRFEHTDLLPPSIDLAALDASPEVELPGLPADRLIVSCVGRMHPDKRMDLLIRAFADALPLLRERDETAAQRAHLVLAGFRETEEDYRGLAAELGIGDRVTLLLDRPREQIVQLLRRSTVFALPSACETFGIVVLEAWATGNLVLVSDRWALPYVVRDGVDGRVCRDEDWPGALADALVEAATPAGRALIEQGERTVRREHDRGARLDKLCGYLERMTAS